jgi:hypothetical protein
LPLNVWRNFWVTWNLFSMTTFLQAILQVRTLKWSKMQKNLNVHSETLNSYNDINTLTQFKNVRNLNFPPCAVNLMSRDTNKTPAWSCCKLKFVKQDVDIPFAGLYPVCLLPDVWHRQRWYWLGRLWWKIQISYILELCECVYIVIRI